MGEVAVVYKINPDLEKKEEIKKELSTIGAKEIKEENIGFGIVSLKVIFVIEDKPNCIEELEEKIGKIKGVNSVQVEGTSLV
jgi:elongation factor 1-beta